MLGVAVVAFFVGGVGAAERDDALVPRPRENRLDLLLRGADELRQRLGQRLVLGARLVAGLPSALVRGKQFVDGLAAQLVA